MRFGVSVLGRGGAMVEEQLRENPGTAFAEIGAGLGLPSWLWIFPFLVLLLILLRNWRAGIWFVLFYVTIEGAVQNYLYPWQLPVLFKDIIVGMTYAGFAGRIVLTQRLPDMKGLLGLPVLLVGGFTFLQGFNPGVPTWGFALIGMRVLLYYIPLYYIGYVFVSSKRQVLTLIAFVLLEAIPIGLFGMYQYVGGSVYVTSLGRGFERTVWMTVGGFFRPSATFAFTGHYGAYLLFMSLVALGALQVRYPRWVRRGLWISLAAIFVSVVLQGQRTNWVILPLLILGIFTSRRALGRLLRLLIPLGVIVALGSLASGGMFVTRFMTYVVNPTEFYLRTLPATHTLDKGFSSDWVFPGHGTGTAVTQTRYLTQGELPPVWEHYSGQLLYMFGLVGLALYAWMYADLLFRLRQAQKRIRDPDLGWVGASLFFYLVWISLSAIFGDPLSYSPTNVYFWFFAGLLSKLSKLEPSPQGEPQLAAAGAGR